MKILHIHCRYDTYGGGEHYLYRICKAQEESGHTVIVMIPQEGGNNHIQDRKVYNVEPSYGLRSGKRTSKSITQVIVNENPDIVHVHQTASVMSPLIVRGISRMKPTVKTVHDVTLICFHAGKEEIKVYKNDFCTYPMGIGCVLRGCYSIGKEGFQKMVLSLWEREVTKGLDKILVSSTYMSDQLEKNGFRKERIEVIPLYTEKGKEYKTEHTENDRMILFVGRLDSVKGVIQFIEALHIMQDKEWQAVIVGDGRLFEKAQDSVGKIGLNGRVTLTGSLPADALDEHYRKACMVVMPSMIPESFGLVGIEAMAFGKPVVAFDSGGISEWLVNGETGFLVERGNVKSLAERISQLLEDESLAKKMGERGKERVERYYRKDMHLKRLLAIYEEVIDNRAKARIYK